MGTQSLSSRQSSPTPSCTSAKSTKTLVPSSPMPVPTNSTTWESKLLISSSPPLDQSQRSKSSTPTLIKVPAEPPTVVRTNATPMPPAHGANPPLLLQAATSLKTPEPSQLLSSPAPN